MPLDPTHVRFSNHACDQWHSSRKSTALTVAIINCTQTPEGMPQKTTFWSCRMNPTRSSNTMKVAALTLTLTWKEATAHHQVQQQQHHPH
jgi:hypothetical protein